MLFRISVGSRFRSRLDLPGRFPPMVEIFNVRLLFCNLVFLLFLLCRRRFLLEVRFRALCWRTIREVEVRVRRMDQLRVNSLALCIKVTAALAGWRYRICVVSTRVSLLIKKVFVVPKCAYPITL